MSHSTTRKRFGNRLWLAAPLAALALAACGGKSSSDDAVGGSSSGGAAGSDSQNGGHSSGGSALGGSGQGGSCSDFDDDDGWSIVVKFTNQTSTVLHVGHYELHCYGAPLFTIRDDATEVSQSGNSCMQPCESVMRSGAIGCPAVCTFTPAITLMPGESSQLIWNGLSVMNLTTPRSCVLAGVEAPPTCDHATAIAPGHFKFRAIAGTTLDCSQTTGTCGACVPNEDGGCTTNAAMIRGTLIGAENAVDLDPGYGVGLGGGDVPLPVELVFKD